MRILKTLYVHFQVFMIRRGFISLAPNELHDQLLKGNLSEKTFYRYLKPEDIEGLVEYHTEQKRMFEESDEIGLTRIDELPEASQGLAHDPLLQNALKRDGHMPMDSEKRRQMIFRLSRLDRIIFDDDLVLKVERAQNRKKNIVERID